MDKPIVFYDGNCGFCNKSVQFVLKHEKNQEIYFSALQSDFTKQFFADHQFKSPDLSTFYYWDGERLHEKSSGILQLLNTLKFPWRILKITYVFPRKLRDYVYDLVAKRRHHLNAGFCTIPNEKQKKRFLN